MRRKKPTTREEAFQILDELLGEEERAKLAACPKDDLGDYHFGLGNRLPARLPLRKNFAATAPSGAENDYFYS